MAKMPCTRGGSTKIALFRSGRRVIYANGTFSLGYLTIPLLAGKLDIFSIGLNVLNGNK